MVRFLYLIRNLVIVALILLTFVWAGERFDASPTVHKPTTTTTTPLIRGTQTIIHETRTWEPWNRPSMGGSMCVGSHNVWVCE